MWHRPFPSLCLAASSVFQYPPLPHPHPSWKACSSDVKEEKRRLFSTISSIKNRLLNKNRRQRKVFRTWQSSNKNKKNSKRIISEYDSRNKSIPSGDVNFIYDFSGVRLHAPPTKMDGTMFFHGKVTVNVLLIAFTFQHRHRALLATNVFQYFIHLELRLLNLLLMSFTSLLSFSLVRLVSFISLSIFLKLESELEFQIRYCDNIFFLTKICWTIHQEIP